MLMRTACCLAGRVCRPIQLSQTFRSKYPLYHKRLGYAYCVATIVGSVGALSLAVHTTNGAAASVGFLVLLLCWNLTLFRGVALAQEKCISEHRKWMLRNYAYTWGAVPFRFMPLIFASWGADHFTAYALGTWFTLVLMVLVGELAVKVCVAVDKEAAVALNKDAAAEQPC